jgi:hypothetical protein
VIFLKYVLKIVILTYKMRHQRRLSVYVGLDSPFIIRYIEPLTGDLFKIYFEDCHFDL